VTALDAFQDHLSIVEAAPISKFFRVWDFLSSVFSIPFQGSLATHQPYCDLAEDTPKRPDINGLQNLE